MLADEGPGRSDNAVRNLKALVDAGLLQQVTGGAPYQRDPRHPFWRFVADTWTVLRAAAESHEQEERVLHEISIERAHQASGATRPPPSSSGGYAGLSKSPA